MEQREKEQEQEQEQGCVNTMQILRFAEVIMGLAPNGINTIQ
jgi:hypothetical protein